MSITNQSKPSPSISNSSQPNRGETWASITTTWLSETRTWGEVSRLIRNYGGSKFGYLLMEDGNHILLETGSGRILLENGPSITNLNRP